MNLTDLLVCGFDGENVVFSANLTPDGTVTVWSSTDANGAVTTHEGPHQTLARFAAFVAALEDLTERPTGPLTPMPPEEMFPPPHAWRPTGQRS